MDIYYTPFYCARLRRIWFPSGFAVCSTKLEKIFWKRKWAFQNLLSYQNLDGILLMNFFTDSVLIILIDFMNFRLTGYAKLYSWTTKFWMCWMEVCQLYEKHFPVNRIRPLKYYYISFSKNLFKRFFSVKQFKIRNYLGDCKWALHQTIAHVIFHQGNKHIYAVWMISGSLARGY